MPAAKNPRITLELEAGADPIRGSIEHPDGDRRPFWGWLELIEELRRVAADEGERRPQPSPGIAGTPSEAEAREKPRTKEER